MAKWNGTVSWPTVLLAVGATVAANVLMQPPTSEAGSNERQAEARPNRHRASERDPLSARGPRPSTLLGQVHEGVREPAREAVSVAATLVRASAVRRNVMRLSSVNEVFSAQERDSEWALESEVLLESAAADLLQPSEAQDTAGRLLRLECHSTLCVIHASHPDPDQQARFASELVMRVGPVLDGAFLARVEGEGGTMETHGFLARRGWVVP